MIERVRLMIEVVRLGVQAGVGFGFLIALSVLWPTRYD